MTMPQTGCVHRASSLTVRIHTLSSERALSTLGPTRNLKKGGVKNAVKNGAQGHGAINVLYTGGTSGPAIVCNAEYAE
jgi:hypothetical protein